MRCRGWGRGGAVRGRRDVPGARGALPELSALGALGGVGAAAWRLSASCLFAARRYGGTFQNVSVKLPITLNKFFQPTEMASQDFFQRWKQLSR